MAIIYCAECGKQISDLAKTCPHCGYPIQEIKNNNIHNQNKAYYREYNKKQLTINLIALLISLVFGYIGTSTQMPLFWVLFIIFSILILILLFVLAPYAIISIMAQKYYHIPKWAIIVSIFLGFDIGAFIALFLVK